MSLVEWEVLFDLLKYKSVEAVYSPEAKAARLLRVPQYKQRTEAWYKVRKSRVTASSAAVLLPRTLETCKEYAETFGVDIQEDTRKTCNPYSTRKEYLTGKCGGSTFKGSPATRWGQKFEDVVVGLYSRRESQVVNEYGLITHPEVPWLAASPDGITVSGRMLEIKCPWRRHITGIPPLYYWIQCQIQLEVCDLEVCDFVEVKLSEYYDEDEYLTDTDTPESDRGIILQTRTPSKKELNAGAEEAFEYPPVNMTNPQELIAWADAKATELETGDPEFCIENSRKVYWRLEQYCNTKIQRSREWFARNKRALYGGHLDIVKYQRAGGKCSRDECEGVKVCEHMVEASLAAIETDFSNSHKKSPPKKIVYITAPPEKCLV